MTMDVRLYILAGTFALMVVSLITVVVIAARAKRRDKPVSLSEHPSMPPFSMDGMSPVDTDLRGLEVPVPENSPHAALLTPLADKPVWEETAPASLRAAHPKRRERGQRPEVVTPAENGAAAVGAAAAAIAEPSAAPTRIEPAIEAAPRPREAEPIQSEHQEFREGPGRIPQIGRREVHRLPSADEILASLEAEMARQEADEPQPVTRTKEDDQRTVDSEPSSDEGVRISAAGFGGPADAEPAPPPRTASGAGVPAEQVQWTPPAAASPPPRPAEIVASTPGEGVAAAKAALEPVVIAEPRPHARPTAAGPVPAPEPVQAARPVVARPAAVVRATEPPSPEPAPEPELEPLEPRPAVRVAGIRVPLGAEESEATVPGEAAAPGGEAGHVPEIELSSPVEMWFGEHRVGVKQGTATFDRLQRYAETLLNDLHDSRDDGTS
jgi:hypothetical protein